MGTTTLPHPAGKARTSEISETDTPFDPLMLVPEGAEYLRLPATTVYRLIKMGELPAIVLSPRRIRLRRGDLDAWLAARATGGVA